MAEIKVDQILPPLRSVDEMLMSCQRLLQNQLEYLERQHKVPGPLTKEEHDIVGNLIRDFKRIKAENPTSDIPDLDGLTPAQIEKLPVSKTKKK